MHNNYGYSWTGRQKYFFNRFLRIFPLYWVACAASLMLIAIWGQSATTQFHESLSAPSDIASWARNVFLFFPHLEDPRLTPPAWALTVELFYYVLIGLGLSKSPRVTVAWFVIAALYHAALNIRGWGFSNLYFPIQAAALPFSIGALIFHYSGKLHVAPARFRAPYVPFILFAVFLTSWYAGLIFDRAGRISFYVALTLNALLIVSLLMQPNIANLKRLDKAAGDFSYPIYLLHYQVGFVTAALAGLIGFPLTRADWQLAVLSLPPLFLVSWLLQTSAGRAIESIRQKVKA